MKENFIKELHSRTENILTNCFSDSIKQEIKEDSNGYLIACPYCGDSTEVEDKKRGHIFLKGNWAGYYKCFNCGKFVDIEHFFTDNNEKLSEESIRYIQEHKQEMCEEK